MMRKHKRRVKSIFPIMIIDVAMIAVILLAYVQLHHVPSKGDGVLQKVVDASSVTVAASATVSPDPDEATATESVVQLQAVQAASPSPTPAVYAPGDFSAGFPATDTGVGALHSYQSDDLRIAINMVQTNDITYYVADVWVKNINSFRTAFAKGEYGIGKVQEPKEIAAANNAVFAVTGDYCGARNNGIVLRNGDLYRNSVSSDACVLYSDGSIVTYNEADFNVMDAVGDGAWQTWGFGPRLLDENGGVLADFSSSIQRKNPRSAIGYYEPGHYCFITVDGRQEGYSVGMTLKELSQTFADLGCKAAFNLDGGATAEMIFQGELVNKPYEGGRESSDIIFFSGN